MLWAVEWDQRAFKDLKKLGKEDQKKVLHYLRDRIASDEDPRRFGKPLRNDKKGFWSYRIGSIRIIAKIEDGYFVVMVMAVGQRCNVYKMR